MYKYQKLFLLLSIIFLFSCVQDDKVEYALTVAKNNRFELEKVLNHYKKDPDKYKAACFLIENMPYHYTYEGWQIDTLKALKKASINNGRINDSIVNLWKNFDYTKLPKIEDVCVADAKTIIENIDLAFNVWNKRPWKRYYNFNDFCEYILPYRISDEPFENWRYIYYHKYSHILDSLYHGNDVI